MNNLIQAVVNNSDEKSALQKLVEGLQATGNRYFLRNEILQAFSEYCQQAQKPAYFYHASSLGQLLHYTHEVILEESYIWLLLRPWVGSQQIWRLTPDLADLEEMEPKDLLEASDRYVNRSQPNLLEIDFGPFYASSPSISDPRNIGQGLTFLNHYLCHQMQEDPAYWLEGLFQVLHQHQYDGIPLLISDRIHSGDQLARHVREALKFVSQRPADEPYEKFHTEMQGLGFEPGWGGTAAHTREMLEILERLIDTPEPAILEAFVARIPAIFRIAIVSVHGWVGQESVLGRPETMSQVVYVLEQARSLDQQLCENIKLAGLDFLGIKPHILILTRLIPNCEGTQCDLPVEKVGDTENTWIVRVPFQEFNPKVTQNWISKYEIWPYLETFAQDAEVALLKHFGGSPNLIIGNYSDGNLVAFLLARRLQVMQCSIAHSLEKPKHLFSNLYWQDLEAQYHFSAQFAADLINMNAADFIVTSSYQEIVGTPDTMGQYESYKCFSMPQLYHVLDGIDLFSPKFNRVPPGVDERVFFPCNQMEKRDTKCRSEVENLLFVREAPYILGQLDDLKKRPILAVASVNGIKNLAGLTEFFGQNQALRDRCNLILVTNKLHSTEAINPAEAREIEKLHALINHYQLQGNLRWIGIRLLSPQLGETYRAIGDRRGIFVHFARFEAFGRVILEAMVSGLPTFATQFGGALEVIEDGTHSFLINPTDYEGTGQKLLSFLDQCDANPEYWQEISNHAIQRVHDEYTWQLHSRQLLSVAKIYSFWNYVHRDTRESLLNYLEALYFLIYKPRVEAILEQHMRR
ncbi:sucrose synthase [Kovacikia minuta CCNUW1]|uniref:sucrose synthase n=1 Tax=Kovacikia minuta TaxID=2931930 RepID=UPI001CD035C0|nr:sucrose synthase [Kovacikia minuta]UBF24821.1 sucrose synthase [Kovacikia minuta CCNUW1]